MHILRFQFSHNLNFPLPQPLVFDLAQSHAILSLRLITSFKLTVIFVSLDFSDQLFKPRFPAQWYSCCPFLLFRVKWQSLWVAFAEHVRRPSHAALISTLSDHFQHLTGQFVMLSWDEIVIRKVHQTVFTYLSDGLQRILDLLPL